MWWVTGSSTHGCWLGTYERRKRKLLERYLTPGMTFFDVGANAGYYTLVGSALVGKAGRVVALEPLPSNVLLLRNHITINRIENVSVIETAISNETGCVGFAQGGHASVGRISASGELRVPSITIDTLVQSGQAPPPDVIKFDIEGGELMALRGARSVLERHRPVLLVATHGTSSRERCAALLKEMAYEVACLDGSSDEMFAIPAS